MNIIFQSDYFPEEQEIWEDFGAMVVKGLCDERHIDQFAPTIARGTIAFHNGDGYKVVEVNNLLTSGMYECDLEQVIRSIVHHVEISIRGT